MKRYVDLVFPVLAVALVGGAALLPASSEEQAEPDRIGVVETSYACPAGRSITLAAGQVKPGEEREIRAGASDTAVAPDATDPSAWATFSPNVPGVVVTERGREAGAEGFFSGTAPKSGGGGLVVGRCGSVVEDSWYLGLGSADRRASTILLSNLSASPAIADLTLFGPEGEVDAIDATGIVLDPFEVRRVRVADLAAGEPLMALRVERRRGVLAAVVNDGSTATFAGTEPIEPTLAPATSQVVPGVAGGVRGKTLLLFNPGPRTARTSVQIVGAEGPFADAKLQDIKLEPGTIQQLAVPDSAGSGRQAYRVTSDQPVAASVRVSPGTTDYVHLEASAPLDGQALVPVTLGKGVTPPRLVLTAPDAAASVRVTAYDAAMTELRAADVALPAGTTQGYDTADVAKGAAYLVVVPQGSVVGAATYSIGERFSSLLLRPVPATIEAPVVTPAE